MKIAVAGKGGVGKTTLSSMLARLYAEEGRPVLAIDADPDANLATAIGLPLDRLDEVRPISEMKDLAEERTGHGGGFGGFFKLNPTVDDLPDSLSADFKGVRILALGSIKHGGTGCVCPEHTLLRTLMSHILLARDEIVVMDMEAGVEHLGRATADSVDVLIIVVEPGSRSITTAEQVKRLAADIGIKRIAYVGSKVANKTDIAFLDKNLPVGAYLGNIFQNEEIHKADMEGTAPFDLGGQALVDVKKIKADLEKFMTTASDGTTTDQGAQPCA